MTITYPLPAANFFDLLKLQDCMMMVQPVQESSQLARGDYLVKDLGPSLWVATFRTISMTADDAMDVQAMIESLRGSLMTFHAYNVRRPFPKSDPTGSIIGANVVQVNAISSDRRSLQVKGLTAGYVLTRGDCVAVTYGLQRSVAYHRVLETNTADGTGLSPFFDVEPAIRQGMAANDVVTLKKPTVQMCLVPRSFQPQSENIFTSFSFSAFQVTTGASPVLLPELFVDAEVFYSPTIIPQVRTLTPGLFTDSQTFSSPVLSANYGLQPGLVNIAETFFAPSVSATFTMLPGLMTDAETYPTPTVTQS